MKGPLVRTLGGPRPEPPCAVPAADVPVPLSKTIDWNFERGVKIKEPGTGKTKSMADFLRLMLRKLCNPA